MALRLGTIFSGQNKTGNFAVRVLNFRLDVSVRRKKLSECRNFKRKRIGDTRCCDIDKPRFMVDVDNNRKNEPGGVETTGGVDKQQRSSKQ